MSSNGVSDGLVRIVAAISPFARIEAQLQYLSQTNAIQNPPPLSNPLPALSYVSLSQFFLPHPAPLNHPHLSKQPSPSPPPPLPLTAHRPNHPLKPKEKSSPSRKILQSPPAKTLFEKKSPPLKPFTHARKAPFFLFFQEGLFSIFSRFFTHPRFFPRRASLPSSDNRI